MAMTVCGALTRAPLVLASRSLVDFLNLQASPLDATRSASSIEDTAILIRPCSEKEH
jgi:hypothetical protein